MCFKAVKEDPKDLDIVPDYFKTQEMCDKTVREDPYYLQYVKLFCDIRASKNMT